MKKSRWGKVREFVFTRPSPTTSAWSRVDMHLLFPDLYDHGNKQKIPQSSTSLLSNSRQVYISSQSVGLYSMHFLGTGDIVALGYGNGRFNLHDLKTCKRLHTGEASPDNMPVTSVRDYMGSSQHRIAAGTADGFLKTFSYTRDEGLIEVSSVNVDDPIYSIDTSENYHLCALDNKKIQVIDAARAEHVRDVGQVTGGDDEEQVGGHRQRVTCVRFNPDNKYQCVSGGWDRTVFLWDIRMDGEKAAVRRIEGPKICGDGIDILDNKCLTASFSTENALQIWDLGSGKLIESVKYRDNDNKAEYLYSCRFLDSTRVVAGGSGSRDAKVINIQTGQTEGHITDSKPIHSVGCGGGVVAAGGVSCYVHVADFGQGG